MRLRCDWNHASFCVMAFKYNKTQFNWDKVKQHLLNQGNISVDIQDLQDKLKAFNKHLDVISGLDFLDTVADNLSSLNPLKQIKTFGYRIALVVGVLLILRLCFSIVWRRMVKRQRSQQQQLAFLTISHHVQNQKGGDVGDREIKEKQALARPQKKFTIIDNLDAIRHETLGTSPEGTVHNLENKI